MLRHALASALLVGLASCGMIPYGSGGESGGGGGGYGQPQQQTRSRTKCTPYFETESSQQCEPWTERVCRTTQKESCSDVQDRNCRALLKGSQTRKCFNVTEQHCSLKENVQFESVQVSFTVQKCRKVPERICDRIFESQSSDQDDMQCLNVENPVCRPLERTVYEQTCRTTTIFDCQQAPEPAPAADYGEEEDSGYGGGSQQQSGGYGGGAASHGGQGGGRAGGQGGYGGGQASGGDYSAPAPAAYGAPEPRQTRVKCNRRQETKCYKTPRVVRQQQCSRQSEKVCERVTLASPTVQERQNCRNEEKKVCVLEERTQPKRVKKYTYNKQCRAVPRRVCQNADHKQLVPSCVDTTRKHCSWTPVEECEDIARQHCFNVDRQVRRERCETVQEPAPSGYGAPAPQQSGYGGGPAAPQQAAPSGYGGGASPQAASSGYDDGNSGYD